MEKKEFKIALVHDFLIQKGGAEKVLEVLVEMYPEAPIYTLLYDQEKVGDMLKGREIRTSYLQKLPKWIRKHHRWLLPFFMVVPETFDFRDYDLVISSTGAWSKGIVSKLSTVHVSYLHSPMRFVWDYNDKYLKEIKQKRMSFWVRLALNYVRTWDFLAAQRPEHLLANSQYTKKRIEKYYRREAQVIYPPVSMEHGVRNMEQEKAKQNLIVKDYFLVISRLSAYKKVSLVVEAFNKLGLPLVVIGAGEEKRKIEKIAKSNVQILGWQNDEIATQYMQNARAFVFPCEDDFGIAPVEAMLCGVPVIAYRKGGALETVEEGVSGEFFAAQTPEVLADGVRRFLKKEASYDKAVIRKKAQRFSKERFKQEFEAYINGIYR